MKLRTLIYLRPLAAAGLLLVAGVAIAASVSTEPRSGFQRINFLFDAPAKMQLSNEGTRVVLDFNDAAPNAASLAGKLKGYVSAIAPSADGKQLTLTLTQPYRVRKFVSGNVVGIDIVGAPDGAAGETQTAATDAPEPEAKPAEDDILSTKKPEPATKAAPTPKAKKEAKKLEPAPKKRAEKPVLVAAVAEEILTTKKPEAAPVPAPAPPSAPKAAPAPEPILTTKAPEPAALVNPAQANKPDLVDQPPEKIILPAEVAATPTPAARKPFLVGARKLDGATVIDFPWAERTAAVVFERGRDIWLVFSRPADASVASLRTVLPQSVIDVTQFAYPGATVLRLRTDGTLHASATQVKGNFGWGIRLQNTPTPPTLDVPISADTTTGERRLLIGAYDIENPVRFYDPEQGDLLLLVPAYEVGRGVIAERRFPEMRISSAGQGIAITTTRDDIATSRSRAGLLISAPDALSISENLPVLSPSAAPAPTNALQAGVLLPYDQWFVAPENFRAALSLKLNAAASATKEARPDALMALVGLYLGQGRGIEAHGYLRILARDFPEFYKARNLALLEAASLFMMDHMVEAAAALGAPELAELEEANLWREAVGLFAPMPGTVQKLQEAMAGAPAPAAAAPAAPDTDTESGVAAKAAVPALAGAAPLRPAFRFLKYNKPFIRFYPPRIRQKLAVIAANAYIENGQEEKAVSTFESLNRDGVLAPVKPHAEFAIATIAAKKGQTDEALTLLDGLAAKTDDTYIAARARYTAAALRYSTGKLDGTQAAEIIERVRLGWRNDKLERDMLVTLAGIYKDSKRYDDTLRSYRALLDSFPGDPEYLALSGQMTDLFESLYIGGVADELPPLKALSLFYEFRDITPVGEKGDLIIQKLADRLASFDLLERATQLLDNQIKFRVSGEARAKIGARLALLQVLNDKPQAALDALQITNYGDAEPALKKQRAQITAQALSDLGKHEEGLSMLFTDTSPEGRLLRLDLLWALKDWPNVVNQAEEIMSARTDLTKALSPVETSVLLKLALGYTFEGDYTQLRYLRDYYASLIPDVAYKQIFDYITNDTTPLDTSDTSMLAKQITNTESFLSVFRDKIANGKLSEAVK